MLISGIQKFTMLDFPEHAAAIVFTPGCNMRCGFCHNREFVLPEEIKKISHSFIGEDVFFNFLKSRQNLLDGVVISGGEPTLQNDLVEFIKQIRKLGFKVKLDTNGAKYDILEKLISDKLIDYVAMDFKTSFSEYNELVGNMIDVSQIKKSVDLLKSGIVDYEFRTTFIKEIHTTEVIEDMKKELNGVEKYFLQTFRNGITLDKSFEKYSPFKPREMEFLKNDFENFVKFVAIR